MNMARVRHVVNPSVDLPEATLDLGLDLLRARFTSCAPRGVRSYSKFRSSIEKIAHWVARDVDPDSFSKLTVLVGPRTELATLFFLFPSTFPFLQILVKDLLRVSPFREPVL